MTRAISLVLTLALLGCASSPAEVHYRQPWPIYKTRADIVKISVDDN